MIHNYCKRIHNFELGGAIMTDLIHVYSEIGKLETVMLHRPGRELENLSPDILNRMLIDDIPYLKIAQKEHDYFAHTLEK